MDTVTGHIILSEMKVELGVHVGELPVMRFGVVQLPGNPLVGNPSSCHRYLLRGMDYNEDTAFICDCGEAFIGYNEAYDHFFNSFRSSEPDLFVNENTKEDTQSSGENGSVTKVVDLQNVRAECHTSHKKEKETDNGSSDKDVESINKSTEIGTNEIVYGCDNQAFVDNNVDVNTTSDSVSNLASDSQDFDNEGDDDLNPQQKIEQKKAKIEAIRSTAEAMFVEYGYPSNFKHTIICAAVLGIHEQTLRKYIAQSHKLKAEDNPYRKSLTPAIIAKAKRVHEEVTNCLNHKQFPKKLKERPEPDIITSVLCAKYKSLSKSYRHILATKLKVGDNQMNVLYKFAMQFKQFEQGPISSEIKAKAKMYDEDIVEKLERENKQE